MIDVGGNLRKEVIVRMEKEKNKGIQNAEKAINDVVEEAKKAWIVEELIPEKNRKRGQEGSCRV